MGVLRNEVPKWLAIAVWAGIQLGLFGYYFYFFYTEDRFFYTRKILRLGLAFARAPANCLNFNCMLILLPVCRNLLSFVRRYLCKFCLRSLRRLMDENITFHKLSAYAICFWTAMHTIAHCYNVELYVTARAPTNDNSNTSVTVYELSALGRGGCPVDPNNPDWVNPICDTGSHSVLEAFKIFPALSGVIITLCLVIIVLSATEFIRRSYFEIFWFTHHLFVIFFAFVFVHGFRGVVRNLEVQSPPHNFTDCVNRPFSSWGQPTMINGIEVIECPKPKFSSNTPSTWKWILAPVILYVIERLIRVVRSFQTVAITKVSQSLLLQVGYLTP